MGLSMYVRTRGRRVEGSRGKGVGTSGGEVVAGGQEVGVDGEGDLVVVVAGAECRLQGLDQRHH